MIFDWLFSSKHTRWVGKVVGVDHGVVHRVRGVDIDTTVTERVLKCSTNADIAISITIHEQKLDLSNWASENLGGRRVADCLVTSNDPVVVCCVRRILVDLTKELLLVLVNLATIERSSIHVGDSIVDIREVFRVGLW